MESKRFNLFLGMFVISLLASVSFVSAGYYNHDYKYYDSYDYRHSYGNSRPNYYHQPNLVSLSSSYKNYDGWIYSSGASNYRSYNSYYPGRSGVSYSDRSYVVNRHYPYYSYVYENDYRESYSPHGYSRHESSNSRKLSMPEAYMVLWSYR